MSKPSVPTEEIRQHLAAVIGRLDLATGVFSECFSDIVAAKEAARALLAACERAEGVERCRRREYEELKRDCPKHAKLEDLRPPHATRMMPGRAFDEWSRNRIVGDFISALNSFGWWLCAEVKKADGSDYFEPRFAPVHGVEKILARYFGIDEGKLEQEKRRMLDEQRALNKEGS